MKKTKNEPIDEKKENPILKKSIQEQIAKNDEDIEINKNSLNKPIINQIEVEKFDKKIENPYNKFSLLYINSKNKFDNYQSNKEFKDPSNVLKSIKIMTEKILKKNVKEINNQKSHKKKSGQFKSTAADFKIKYKTELCKYFEINGYCKYGDNCAYAHGKDNLRSKITNTTAYRTKKCSQFFQNGYCPYGNRCQFAHQVSSNIINNPYDRKMTYKKALETLSKKENIENIKDLIPKPRLTVFQEIINIDKEKTKSLLDDIRNIYKQGIFERIDTWFLLKLALINIYFEIWSVL